MAGVSITVDTSDLDRVIAKFGGLDKIPTSDLMEGIGAIGESQTRRRITDEKTGPDGQAWPANREGTSILLRTGQHLLASVAYVAGGDTAEWGASWEFAHVHQFGATIKPKNKKRLSFLVGGNRVSAKQVKIPARPFVGISSENETEIEEILQDWAERLFSA